MGSNSGYTVAEPAETTARTEYHQNARSVKHRDTNYT
jgi:hypothetical protein